MALRVTRVRSSPRRKGRRDIYKSKGDVDFISSPRKMRINRAKIPSTILEILLEKWKTGGRNRYTYVQRPPHDRPSWIKRRNNVSSRNRFWDRSIRKKGILFNAKHRFFFNIHSRIFLSSIEINLRQREEIAFATKKRIWRKKEGDFFFTTLGISRNFQENNNIERNLDEIHEKEKEGKRKKEMTSKR